MSNNEMLNKKSTMWKVIMVSCDGVKHDLMSGFKTEEEAIKYAEENNLDVWIVEKEREEMRIVNKWKVVMVSGGGVKHDLVCGFETEEEANEYAEENDWCYVDENRFEWRLAVEEDEWGSTVEEIPGYIPVWYVYQINRDKKKHFAHFYTEDEATKYADLIGWNYTDNDGTDYKLIVEKDYVIKADDEKPAAEAVENMEEHEEMKTVHKTYYTFADPSWKEVFEFSRNIEDRISRYASDEVWTVDIVSGETGEVFAIRDELGLWEILKEDSKKYDPDETVKPIPSAEEHKIPEALEALAVDGFETDDIHRGDIVKYPTEGMDVPEVGEMFRVGRHVGTCIGVSDDHVLMYVQG